jgi:hemerythrin-like domain-containing protein
MRWLCRNIYRGIGGGRSRRKMKPIGPLMIEHRLIERMIGLLREEARREGENQLLSTVLLDNAIDFFRTYADRTHHGKEEDILFRDLEAKNLEGELKDTMEQLIGQHVYARRTVSSLAEAKEAYLNGDERVLSDIREILDDLSNFYIRHIALEDKHFFIPCMEYFDQDEQDAMLRAFYEFDRGMIHEKYRRLVESYESNAGPVPPGGFIP